MLVSLTTTVTATVTAAEPLKMATFAVAASSPVGSPLAYGPAKGGLIPLSCRGVILQGRGDWSAMQWDCDSGSIFESP